jgi:uncharacterized protein YbaR (Trm112 family)
MQINMDMVKVLACPQCSAGLTINSDGSLLTCSKCESNYQVKNGIPILLTERANEVSYENFSKTKTESIEFYENFYKGQYDYRRFSGPDRAFSRLIFDKLNFSAPNPIIVDIGAGTGYFGKLFEDLNQGYQVYNADFSYEGFRTAQEIYGLDKLAVMDAYRVAFLPNTVDAIFAIGLTPYKKSEQKDISFLTERVVRPLKSGGYYVFIWSSNLRDTVDEISTIRSDQEVNKTFYYNHSRPFIEKVFAETGLFSSISGYTFLRPLSMVLGQSLLSKPTTIFTETVMRFAPKSLTARMVIIGRKK